MRPPSDSDVVAARRMLLFVGLAFLVAQLLAFSVNRPPSWDEAIYLSQVDPGAEPLPFVPSRARGITFLAAPVLQLGGSLAHLRLFLAVASAAALTAAFRSWANVIGSGAVAAAVLFAGSWPALFYGSELMPNLWVALTCIGATAILARRLAIREARYDELLAGGLVAIAALLRPLDAVVLVAALILLPIAVRRATIAWTVHVTLGLVAGWTPWLVEMIGRFGSPADAFTAAARLGHTGRWALLENVHQYLALSDGPSIGPVAQPRIPASGILWLLGMAALVIVGIRAAAGARLLPSLVVPTATGAALAAEYIVFTEAQAPRFLLPAGAMLAIPAGLGFTWIVDRARDQRSARTGRWVAVAVASTLVVGWALLQIGIAARLEASVTQQRASAQRAGARIRGLAGPGPCHVYSEASFPIVGYAAGCRAAPIGNVVRAWPERAARLERDGIRPFLVLHRAEQPAVPEGASPLATIPSAGQSSWFIYGVG